MTKTKPKQKHLTASEVKAEMNEEAEQKIDKACAEELEALLKKHNRAFQPFIQRTEFADIARVRLVRVDPKPEEDGQE